MLISTDPHCPTHPLHRRPCPICGGGVFCRLPLAVQVSTWDYETWVCTPPRVRCDGNHGGPACADPECWARDDCPECGQPLAGCFPTCLNCQVVAALKAGDVEGV